MVQTRKMLACVLAIVMVLGVGYTPSAFAQAGMAELMAMIKDLQDQVAVLKNEVNTVKGTGDTVVMRIQCIFVFSNTV